MLSVKIQSFLSEDKVLFISVKQVMMLGVVPVIQLSTLSENFRQAFIISIFLCHCDLQVSAGLAAKQKLDSTNTIAANLWREVRKQYNMLTFHKLTIAALAIFR